MNRILLTPLLLIFLFQFALAQGGAPLVRDAGAGAACKTDPISFFNQFTEGDQMKFEFRTLSPSAEEIEKGVMFQVDAVIATGGAGSKIVAGSVKAKKVFKAGEIFTPKEIFNSNDLLFANKYLSKLKPGMYKVIFSMAALNPADRKKYKTARQAYTFVWR